MLNITTTLLSASDYNLDDSSSYCNTIENEYQPHIHSQRHFISIGPEYNYIKRTREGGVRQSGNTIGLRANYDYISRYCFYVGAQAYYGTGTLNGNSGYDTKIKSKWVDQLVEGYLGYTFQGKESPNFSFTPYAGFGYICEANKFGSPSPLHLKFTTKFRYFAYGFISSAMVLPYLKIGLNGRFRSPYDPKCKVSNDPDFENITQIVGEHLQYRIELPITYLANLICGHCQISVTPFYEERKYEGRRNYPFDFFKTSYRMYGFNLQAVFTF